jgi:hypothetical protein
LYSLQVYQEHKQAYTIIITTFLYVNNYVKWLVGHSSIGTTILCMINQILLTGIKTERYSAMYIFQQNTTIKIEYR